MAWKNTIVTTGLDRMIACHSHLECGPTKVTKSKEPYGVLVLPLAHGLSKSNQSRKDSYNKSLGLPRLFKSLWELLKHFQQLAWNSNYSGYCWLRLLRPSMWNLLWTLYRYGANLGGTLCYTHNPILRLFSHTCLHTMSDNNQMRPHKKHKQHDKQHHHSGGAARPSSGVDLMNPCRWRGGRPSPYFFRCCHRSDLIDSIN